MAFLEKRKNARGESIWVIHYRVGSKQRMKTVGKTDKRTAEQVLRRFEIELAQNEYSLIEFKKVTLLEYVQEFFRNTSVERATTTIRRERQILSHLLDYFQNMYIADLTLQDLEAYRSHRLSKVKPETVNIEFRHLKAIFNKAVAYKYLKANPFDSIKLLRSTESELPRFFELDEIAIVRKAFSGDDFELLVEFYLVTGCRLREPLSLTWDQVDFKRQQITVRSVHTKGKKNRIISFQTNQAIETILKSLTLRSDQLLFGPPDDRPQWSHTWVSKKISRRLSRAGFPWASCHTFRHTYISHLVMAGVPLLTVKEIVGHSDFTTTLRYAHLAPEHKQDMIDKLPY